MRVTHIREGLTGAIREVSYIVIRHVTVPIDASVTSVTAVAGTVIVSYGKVSNHTIELI